MGLLALGLCSNFYRLKLLFREEPRAPFAGTFSTANLSLTTTAAATRESSHNKLLLYLQLFDATAHSRVYILRVATFISSIPAYPYLRYILLFHFKPNKPC